MLSEFLTFQFGGFYGGSIGNILSYWEQAGVFSYVLPFLLIFALVFGIMNQIRLFENNKAINGIIAMVVGLLSLQFNFVPLFFSEIFPRLGVGLAVLLVLMILTGMFIDPGEKGIMYSLLGIGAVIFLIVLTKTFGWLGWQSSYIWQAYGGAIIGVGLILIVLGIVINGSRPKGVRQVPDYRGLWPYGGVPPKAS